MGLSPALVAIQSSPIAHLLAIPPSPNHTESIASYWAQQASEVRPAGILRPWTASDVSRALKILTQTNLDNGFNTPFAIRSGGHSTYAGASNLDGGLILDLRDLRSLKVVQVEDGSGFAVRVGTGARWGDVYGYLDSMQLMVPGGRVASVGVGGLTLGGGLSYFAGKEGFVCDNVLEFQVVLADGSIVSASSAEREDLWRALKGGGNNFGVVTRFTMRVFRGSSIWGGLVISDFSTMQDQIEEFHRVIEPDVFESAAGVMVAAAYNGEFGKVSYNSFKYTEEVERPGFLEGFMGIGGVLKSTMRTGSLKEMVEEEGHSSTSGLRRSFMTRSFYNNLPTLQKAVQLWEDCIPSVSKVKGVNFSAVYDPITPIMVQRSRDCGGNVLGLSGDRTLIVSVVSATWVDAQDDKTMTDACRAYITNLEGAAKGHGAYHPYTYMNYAWEDQPVLRGYGEGSSSFLQTVREKYDPHGVFQRAVPGGFKLIPVSRL